MNEWLRATNPKQQFESFGDDSTFTVLYIYIWYIHDWWRRCDFTSQNYQKIN